MQIKTKRALSASTVASLLLTSSVVSVNVKAATVTPPESPRLWGADRYETAVKVSQTGWTSGSDYAVVASGEGYADALCAAPLAKANNAPILLTEKGALTQKTLDELKRLNVKHVFIIGGQGVVSQVVEDAIKANVTSDIQRLWGQNRYETSVKVAEKLGTPSKIVLASGEGYADALSAAPVAAIEGMPILLTESKTLSKATSDYIKSNASITKTYVIGGYASVSDAAMNAAPSPQRFGGVDRYETNAAVINAFALDFDFKNVYVALGNGPVGNEFADALTASAIAAKNKNPLVIVGKELNSATQTLLKSKLLASSTITVLGGAANVSDTLASQIKSLGAPTTSPSGGGSSGGSSGGGSSSNITYLNEAGKTYNGTYATAHITASNVTLTGNVNGDLYIDNGADHALISNITVTGDVYINPGANGTATLSNVKAKNIVIQSGASNSIYLNNVTADTLDVKSSSNVHVKSQDSNIGSTKIESQVILEAASGSFGTITIPQNTSSNKVELRGTFDNPIIIQGNVELITNASTNIPSIIIPADATASGINIKGSGTIINIQVKIAGVTLNLDSSMSVTGVIQILKGATINASSEIKNNIETKTSVGDMSKDLDKAKFKDLTSAVATVYGSKIQSYLSSHPTIDKYLDVTTTGSSITFDITKNWNTISSLFTSIQGEDQTKLINRINTFGDLLEMPFISDAKIGNDGVIDYLKNIYPSFFTNGKLDANVICKKIKSNEFTYAGFKSDLINKIKNENTSHIGPRISFALNSTTSPSSETNLKVHKIVKDGSTVIYDKNASEDTNLKFLDKDNVSDLLGTYTIYSGSNLIKITITQ